jgi:hypothetical protein
MTLDHKKELASKSLCCFGPVKFCHSLPDFAVISSHNNAASLMISLFWLILLKASNFERNQRTTEKQVLESEFLKVSS